MPRFSTNISMMFMEHEFLQRFGAAKAAGFDAVEMQFPYDTPIEDLVSVQQETGFEIAVININAGDLLTGGPGISAYPGREDQFKAAVEEAHRYAVALHPKNMNVLAGWPPMDTFEREQCLDVLAANLHYAAEVLAELDVTVLTESVNAPDRPGYLLNRTAEAIDVIDRAGHANLAIEYDIYHMQIMEGDLVNTMRDNLSRIGHIQFADTPGRHEPGTGEINFPFLFEAIDEMGWEGYLGAEYVPSGPTEETLGWMPG